MVNEAYCDLVGYTEKGLVGKYAADNLAGLDTDLEEWVTTNIQLLKGLPVAGRGVLKLKQGDRLVEWSSAPIPIRDGNMEFSCAVSLLSIL